MVQSGGNATTLSCDSEAAPQSGATVSNPTPNRACTLALTPTITHNVFLQAKG